MNCAVRKNKSEKLQPWRLASAVGMSFLLFFGQTVPLLANPTGGAVVAGGATIGAAGATLSVNQSTHNAIINWQTFSIANGETTKFIVPNSGATLNRVAAGNPSAIYGNLQSNGTLYLINPSGILVGPSGRINTASFLASTLDVSNEQFLAGGDMEFSGSSDAAINNAGVIHASTGDVYLIANQVNNNGAVLAPKGTIGMAAGSDVLFQQAGSQHLFVQATPAGTKRATGLTNAGTIRAASAELKAAGGNAYALAINNVGVIVATGYKKVNGQVYLTSDGGSISNSGKISAKQANGNGGTIVMDGTAIASNVRGTVTNSGTLNASATVAGGEGGSVTVKNMGGTTIHSGAILAEGGQGGAGGDAEVSGANLTLSGTVNLTAPGGTTGNLLLDPATLTVVSGGALTSGSFTSSGGTDTNPVDSGASDSVDPSVVEGLLSTANLTLNADTNITVSDAITWTSTNTLTLSTNTAGSTIDLNAPISGVNGGLTIDTKAPADVISPNASVQVSNFILQDGLWQQINPTLPTFIASNDFELQNNSIFRRYTGGDGSSGSPYQITDIYGLQGINSAYANQLGSYYTLMNDLSLDGETYESTESWNGGKGFVPIGTVSNPFTGTLDGQGFAIPELEIVLPTTNDVGLFGVTSSTAVLKNLVMDGGFVQGGSIVGELVGDNQGTIQNVTLLGSANGSSDVGVVAGVNSGSITDTSVINGSAYGTDAVGGLVGENVGSISNSYSSGTVVGDGSAGEVNGSICLGGLVGQMDAGTLSNVYSTAAVDVDMSTGNIDVGGLVGDFTAGSISNAYSTGKMPASSSVTGLGGFIGQDDNGTTLSNSFWDNGTTGASAAIGLDEGNLASNVSGDSTATLLTASTYSNAGWNIGTTQTFNTWVIFDGQTRPMLSMEYSTTIYDAHQMQLIGLNTTTLGANYIEKGADGSGTDNPSDVWGTSTTSGSGFLPIGTEYIPFTGHFDGQGEGIYDFYIDRLSTFYVGIFGTTGSSAIISNVNVADNEIKGGDYVGTLVGSNAGTLINDNVFSDTESPNAVVAGNMFNSSYLGGLAGYNGGTISGSSVSALSVEGASVIGGLVGQNAGSITTSYSTAAVSGTTTLGGLVGENDGSIGQSYSAGTILSNSGNNQVGGLAGSNSGSLNEDYSDETIDIGGAGFEVGGLVGANFVFNGAFQDEVFGSISNSYNIGSVTTGSGSTDVGGLVGYNAVESGPDADPAAGSGAITDSYNSGVITTGGGSSIVGGLVGDTTGHTVTGSFWDMDTSGVASGVGTDTSNTTSGVTGVTTAASIMQSTYSGAGWNIGTDATNNTWVIFDGQTRPMLGMEYGTTIHTAHGLQLIGLNSTTLSANYELESVGVTLDLSGTTNVSDIWATDTVNGGSGFIPIGTSATPFTGTFNGGYETLSGLYIDQPSTDDVGLFGVATGLIDYTTLTNVQVTGNNDVGGLVGLLGVASETQGTGRLISVSSSGTVTGFGDNVGGLVGLAHGTLIASASSTGTVSGSDYVGGLIGSGLGAVSDAYSQAAVSGGVEVGGLMGENDGGGIVHNTYSSGTVVGNSEVGGLIGNNLGSVNNSFWDTTTSGITSLGVGSGSTSGVTAATTTQLETQSFITANAPVLPSWNYTGVWEVYSGYQLPTLFGVASNNLPSATNPTLDMLSGTAFTDNGTTAEGAGDLIEFFFDGASLGSTTTNSMGAFNFSFTSSELSTGVLLSDTSVSGGNTYYQANTPAATITGVDIYGDTIRVMADTASNSALAAAAGSLTSGVNFGISNGNLTTNTNSFTILAGSSYVLDGNITAKNITISGAVSSPNTFLTTLSAAGNVTIGADVTMDGGGDITLRADNAGTGAGTVVFTNGAQVTTDGNVNIFYNPSVNPAASAVNTTSYVNPTEDFSSDVTGGAMLNAYMLVNTVNDLQNMQNNLSGTYALGRSIDATVTSGWNSGAGFVPIGNSATAFTGSFNGQGDTIDSLTVNQPSGSYIGLFGETSTGTIIENVGLTNARMTGLEYVAGLVGENQGTIRNTSSTGTVNGTYVSGGLVGINLSGTVATSYSGGTVSGFEDLGGLAGVNYGSFSDDYSVAAVNGSASSQDVGGLIGANSGTVATSYSSGLVTVASGSTHTGGFVGYNDLGTISNSFWDTDTSGQTVGIGAGTVTGATGETTTTSLSESTYSGSGWSIGSDPTSSTWVIFDGQTRPMLSMEYSTTITNAHQLQLTGLNATTLAANYTVSNNIDLSGTKNPSEVWGTSVSSDGSGGGGFVPIGNGSNSFTGSFDGQGHAIDGLYINTPSVGYVALFGQVGLGATVENVGVTNESISGGTYEVGGLVGSDFGLLSYVYTTGTVSGASGGDFVGGLVGGSSGTVDNAYSTTTVSGGSDVGGLVGADGGGTINNAYSAGVVTGTSAIGGLVGLTNGGTIANSYSTAAVSGSSLVGGLVGDNSSGGAGLISNSFWDTDTAGVTLGVGSDSSNTTSGVTSATTSELTSQSFITANATTSPGYDFNNVWTTVNGTLTPQLIGLPETALPTASGTDLLSGTAFTDGGSTISANTLIDLLFNGGMLGSTTTDGSGDFSFSVTSAELSGGVLLTDPTDKGNTYFEANSPASAISRIDIWGSTLRVVADTASNTALGTAAGSQTGVGINYALSGANLSTTSGVNMYILSNFAQSGVVSNYTLDGNITASGILSTNPLAQTTSTTAGFSGSQAVTLTGSEVDLTSNFALGGKLTVVSTNGQINLKGVGTSSTSATAEGITLTSASAVTLSDSFLATGGDAFSATGTGYVSTVDANGDATGIDMAGTTINAEGGTVTLTGTGGYVSNGNGGLDGGMGVSLLATVNPNLIETSGSGNITIMATFNQNITSSAQLQGFSMYGTSNSIRVATGTISITGKVLQGTASGTGSNGASVGGVEIGGGAALSATGMGGSISVTGDASGGTSVVSSTDFAFSSGIEIGGDSGPSTTLTVASGGRITLNGTGGTLNASSSTSTDGDIFTVGVMTDNGASITTGANATLAITGTGGSVVTTGAISGNSHGISLEEGSYTLGTGNTFSVVGHGGAVASATGANVGNEESDGINLNGYGTPLNMTVGTGSTVGFTGYGGTLNTSLGSDPGSNLPASTGITMDEGVDLSALGNTPVTFTGTGGTVNGGSGQIGQSIGVNISSDTQGANTTLSSVSGTIQLTGVAGSTPNLGVGVLVAGSDGAVASVESTSGSIDVNGTGGAGNSGVGSYTGFYQPNFGVAIVDNAFVGTTGTASPLNIRGTGGSNNAAGVAIFELPSGSIEDSAIVSPTINLGTGALSIASLTNSGILIENASISAQSATTIASGNLTIENSSVTLAGGGFNGSGTGYVSSVDQNGDSNGVHLIDSTINAEGGTITLTGHAGYDNQGSGLAGGVGVHLDGDAILETTGSGDIILNGTAAQNVGVTAGTNGADFTGVALDGTGNSVQVGAGEISIIGTVSAGTAGNSSDQGYIAGISIRDGTLIQATASGGQISLIGNTSGSTAYDSASNGSGQNQGIAIGGNSSPNTIISVGTNGTLTLSGTSGTVDSTYATSYDNTGQANGIDIETLTQITGGTGAAISLTGTGGSAITDDRNASATGTSYTGQASGVSIGDDQSQGGLAQITVGTGGSITMTGSGGSINISNDVATTTKQSDTQGAHIHNGTQVVASGTSTITLHGTGGTVTAGSNTFGDATGVFINSSKTGENSLVSAGSGLISISGTGGPGPGQSFGFALVGTNGGTAEIESTSGNITISGSGGTGYGGTGSIVNNYVPNYGVFVADAATLLTGAAGAINLTGTGGGNGSGGSYSLGVDVQEITGDAGLDTAPVTPVVTAGGAFTVSTLSGTGINFGASLTAPSAALTSSGVVAINNPITSVAGPINIQGTIITLNAAIAATNGNAVLVDTTQFVNNAGSTALTASNGHNWQVWSVNPPGSGQGTVDNDGGLTPSFIQYGATYGTTTPAASGNGLFYSYAPAALSVTLNGTFTKTYDDTTSLTIAANSYSFSSNGLVSGDAIDVASFSALSGTLNSKDVTTANTVTVTPGQIGYDVFRGSTPVYGYTVNSVSAPASVTPATLTASLTGTVSKTYNGTTTATLDSSNYNLAGVFSGDTVTLNDPTSGTYSDPNVGTGKTVSVSGLALLGSNAGDYTLASTSISGAVGTIIAAGLSPVLGILTGTVSKVYDGTTTVSNLTSANYSLTGVLNGDDVTLTGPTTGSYATGDVGTNILVTSSTGLSLSGAQASDYVLTNTQASGNIGTITPATLTVGLTGTVSKVYDSTTAAALSSSNYNLGGIFGNDSVMVSSTTGSYASKDVGTGITISVTGLVLSGAQAGDYMLGSTSANGAIGTITPATLTASLTGTASKVYNSTTTAALSGSNYNLSGVFSGDTVTLNDPTSGTYDTKDVGTGKTVTATGLALLGAQAGDYVLASTSANATIGTITAATLTASLTGTVSKVYDSTTTATLSGANYNLPGVFGGDTVTLNDPASGTFDTKDVGTGKTVTATGLALSGAQAGDYVLASSSANGTIGTVTPATLTASLTGTVSKVYDTSTTATLDSSNYDLAGLFNGDVVGVSGSATYDTKDVGTGKTIAASGLALTGAQAGDYTLSTTSANAAIGTITAATVTATLTGTVSKVYDSTTTATLDGSNYDLAGVYDSDRVTLNDPTSGTYDTKDAGTDKIVTATGLALGGRDANDYVLASTSANGTVGTITQATVTASLTGTVSKVYDGTTAATLDATNVNLTGVYSGDTVGITGTGTYNTQNVGSGIAVTSGTLALTGADANNYQISGQPSPASIGTITPATLVYTATPVTVAPGTELPAFTGSVTGFATGDNLANATGGTLNFTSPATSSSDVGSYAIDGGGLTASNYIFAQASGNATALTIEVPPMPTPTPTPVVSSLPSTMTGGAADGGSNLVPPALTPQVVQVAQQNTTTTTTTTTGNDGSNTTAQPPPFSFAGTGVSNLLGQLEGGLANSGSNSGQVGTGDTAQINGGQLNNVANPQAAGVLNEALGPIVYQNLADALRTMGDWADVPQSSSNTTAGGEGETILTGGDVAEMSGSGVKNIPLNQAPEQLRDAMNGDVLKGMGSGH